MGQQQSGQARQAAPQQTAQAQQPIASQPVGGVVKFPDMPVPDDVDNNVQDQQNDKTPKGEEDESKNNLPGDDAEAGKESGKEGEVRKEQTEKVKNHNQRRWEENIRRRAAAEERVKILEEQNSALRDVIEGGRGAKRGGEPTREDYETDIDFFDARARYHADKIASEKIAEIQSAQANATMVDRMHAKMREASKEYADYNVVVGNANSADMLPHVAKAVFEADLAGHIAYHLAKNEEMIEVLNEMSPNRVLIEIGKIEAKIEASRSSGAAKTSSAPPPVKPVAAKGEPHVDENKLSDEDWFRQMQLRKRKMNTNS